MRLRTEWVRAAGDVAAALRRPGNKYLPTDLTSAVTQWIEAEHRLDRTADDNLEKLPKVQGRFELAIEWLAFDTEPGDAIDEDELHWAMLATGATTKSDERRLSIYVRDHPEDLELARALKLKYDAELEATDAALRTALESATRVVDGDNHIVPVPEISDS